MLGYHTKHHIIFYNIINENKIEIIRILGREMDLKNRLKKDNL
ncbi:type II toxin-antitoxin system RelE/ParE family toxin [Sphingobacterium daejeonense]